LSILVLLAFLIGSVLGMRLKVLILILATGSALTVVLAAGIASASLSAIFIAAGLASINL